ncbi:MAG: M28 family metallopeptidase [Thermoanaerobaculia bacterium]
MTRKIQIIGVLAALAAFGAIAAEYALPAGAAQAAQAVEAEYLRGHVAFLADDLLEGRGPATRGDELTQVYLATQMQLLGLEPGMPDGTWYQNFDIVGVHAQPPEAWTFRTNGETIAFENSDDFIVASGVQESNAAVENAEVVFVGYGIDAPEHQWNDFKGMDVRGKVLLVMNNDPDWDPKLFEGNRRLYYGRWTYKYEEAARRGAAGVIIIHTTPSAGYPWQVVQTSWSGEQFELPAEGEPRIQLKGWMTEDASRRLVAAAGKDLDALVKSARSHGFQPVPLGITTSMSMPVAVARKETANVIGVLPGSDLKDEYVVYSAHHDHLGLAEEADETGDRIYNGALDNATGVAQVLAIARAFTRLPEPPRRSIIFAFVGAEEQGLLGAKYYAAHPTVPPGKMAANINIDGGNIWGRTRDVVQVGYGKSSADDVVSHFAEQQGRVLKPEQFPDRGSYYRSDQFAFANIGVPAIYLDSGVDYVGRPENWGREQIEAWEATHYHQPSDELTDEWSFEGMVQDARLAFNAGLAIATMDAMPAWNPGDEFEAARKRALAEAE